MKFLKIWSFKKNILPSLLTIFPVSSCCLFCFAQVKSKPFSLTISNVTIIPIYKDTVIRNVDLFVTGGKITGIERHIKSRNLSLLSERIIDGNGKYIIPGLVDCHVHYGNNEQLFSSYDSLYLKYGVTRVLALSGNDKLLEHRKRIKAGTAIGPDIFCSSPQNNDSLLTVKQADSLMAQYKAKGYEFIKIYTEISKDGFLEYCKKAASYNLRLLGHIPKRVGTFGVLHSKMELIAHAEEFLYNPPVNYFMGEISQPMKPDELYIQPLADSVFQYKKFVSPTLITFKSILESARDIAKYTKSVPLPQNHPIANYWKWSPSASFIPKKFSRQLSISRLQFAYDYQLKLVKAFNKKGVIMLAGTDAPTMPGLVPGYSLHQELQMLSKVGLSNYDILKSATLNAAQFLNISNTSGTIENNKEASFILLLKNPLVDIKNTLSIDRVFFYGREIRK